MQLTWDEILENAVRFSNRQWEGGGKEKQQGEAFVRAFLRVFGVEEDVLDGGFQTAVSIRGRDKYIDYLQPGIIAIETKSRGENLEKALKKQLTEYMQNLPNPEDVPDLWMVCDFENIRLNRRSTNEIWKFKTKDLKKHIMKFADVAGYATERTYDDQVEVDVKAAEKMAKLHDALKSHGYEGHDLEVYLVRLLFCMFADDTGIFPENSFYRYFLKTKYDGSDLSKYISDLFEVLNMPNEVRAKKTLMSNELKNNFRYINGGLFEHRLPPADFDEKMRKTLRECIEFNWSEISPAIFGAMFQGVMNKEKRRELGAHYTSQRNIENVIDPLFMDDLWNEFDRVKTDPVALDRFHDKIAKLKFLDPACGCGNFLIVTYRKLRELELKILEMKSTRQKVLDIEHLMKVNVEQFYGIECEDFPCQIAIVGMWLVDHQMNMKVSDAFGQYFVRLPLTKSARIVHGNALRLDWNDIVRKDELSFILGNPPFIGHQNRTDEQIEDMDIVYRGSTDKYGKLDYVCCWYRKAVGYMIGTEIKAAFVSTNSIVQGESVNLMWKPLFELGYEIIFAYRPFIWGNEAKSKAAVHCVIIGFAKKGTVKIKKIYEKDTNTATEVENIDGRLRSASDIFIKSRGKSLSKNLPKICKGSQPTDGRNLLLSSEEYEEFVNQHPHLVDLIRRYVGADEFINNELRYCFWLKGVEPSLYRNIKPIKERLDKISELRRKSPTASVRRDAETPYLFTQIRQPDVDFLIIPRHSVGHRKYIPMGFLTPEVIASDATYIIPNATLYTFAIMTSIVHMAWVRVVCGRLKSDYRYTPAIYNNFPWLDVTDEQKDKLEKLAQAVLDARALYPNSSLADLYDSRIGMMPELGKAHKDLDKEVMKLYGIDKDATESVILSELTDRYRGLVNKESEAKPKGKKE